MSGGSPTERFGPYLVYEQLGIGGMARIHRAVDSDVRRPVALKRMLSHIAGKDEMVRSFVREARLASYLRHDNVAQTYDLGKVGDVYFSVMELLTNRALFAGRDDILTLTRVRDMHLDPPSQINPHVPPEIDEREVVPRAPAAALAPRPPARRRRVLAVLLIGLAATTAAATAYFAVPLLT